MPVHVKCPGCGTVLAAPESAAGSVLSCPQCRNQFMVPGAPPVPAMAGMPPASSAAPTAGAPPLPGNAMLPPGAAAPMLSAAPAPSMLSGSRSPTGGGNVATSAAMPPPAAGSRAPNYPPGQVTANPAASMAANSMNAAPPPSRTANAYPPGMVPPAAPPNSKSTAAPPVKSNSAASPPATRQSQAAKFIAADASATRIDLGADGRLPALQLEELDEDEGPEEPKGSNPWLMVGVLAFSVLASVAMLFLEPSAGPSQLTKHDIRRKIQDYYLPSQEQMANGAVQLKPYQKKLKEGLIAFNRGDFLTENRCYREVLDMLHVENKSEFTGLTGNARGETPPNDRDLEELVSALLNRR